MGETEFLLAKTLDQLGVSTPEPRALATQALEHLGEEDGDIVANAEVVAWLAD